MDSGWIKLHRSMLEWEWYNDTNVKVLWLHILLRANHRATRYQGHDIPAGSLVGGYPALASQLNLSVRNIRTALKKLKSTGEVTVKTHSKFSIITVSKWDEYQLTDRQLDSHPTGKRQASDSQVTTSKECKKERREEGKNNITPLTPQGGNESEVPPSPKPKPKKKKDYGPEAEDFWANTKHLRRPEDDKQAVLKKFEARRKEGFSSGQIKESVEAHWANMASWDRKWGLRRMLEPKNVEQGLEADFAKQNNSKPNFSASNVGSFGQFFNADTSDLPELVPPERAISL